MDLTLLMRGVVLGFSIAAPVGPIGILCIHRTLAEGCAAGIVSGLGAATADAFYGCVAAFGLVSVSSFLSGQRTALRLLGGVFLCYLGLRALVARPPETPSRAGTRGLLHAYASTVLLTLTNPMTILSFAALFSALGIAGDRASYASASSLVIGVFVGSASWWLVLSVLVGALRNRVSARAMRWANRGAGAAMIAFAALVFAGAL